MDMLISKFPILVLLFSLFILVSYIVWAFGEEIIAWFENTSTTPGDEKDPLEISEEYMKEVLENNKSFDEV